MAKRVYVVPVGIYFDPCVQRLKPVAYINVKDVHLPWESEQGAFLFLGGAVEPGETPEEAALRELQEEAPGWYEVARMKGTHPLYGSAPHKKAKQGLLPYTQEGVDEAERMYFAAYVDVGPASFRRLVNSSTEGSIISFTPQMVKNGIYTEKSFCFPEAFAVVMGILERVQTYIDSIYVAPADNLKK